MIRYEVGGELDVGLKWDAEAGQYVRTRLLIGLLEGGQLSGQQQHDGRCARAELWRAAAQAAALQPAAQRRLLLRLGQHGPWRSLLGPAHLGEVLGAADSVPPLDAPVGVSTTFALHASQEDVGRRQHLAVVAHLLFQLAQPRA